MILYSFSDKELMGIILQLKFLSETFNCYFIELFLYCHINEKWHTKERVFANQVMMISLTLESTVANKYMYIFI